MLVINLDGKVGTLELYIPRTANICDHEGGSYTAKEDAQIRKTSR